MADASRIPERAPDPRARDNARLTALLAELDRPLDTTDWRKSSAARPGGGSLAASLRRERQHRRELRRAREAAARAFGVRPRLSTRKRATLMLTGGAIGLAAFSGPVPAHDRAPEAGALVDLAGRRPPETLRASSAFKSALAQSEGVRRTVYRDIAGFPTVGIGHLVRPGDGLRPGDTISEARVAALLDGDLARAEADVRELVGDLPLHQYEFDALLDLVYNVGGGTVDLARSPRLNAAIAAGDYDAMAQELTYTRAGGRHAPGLANRSERRTAMFTKARYEDPGPAAQS